MIRSRGVYDFYDLQGDPHEKFNVYGQPRQRAIQDGLESRLKRFFDNTAEPKYDLYRDGTSKATLLTGRRG